MYSTSHIYMSLVLNRFVGNQSHRNISQQTEKSSSKAWLLNLVYRSSISRKIIMRYVENELIDSYLRQQQ